MARAKKTEDETRKEPSAEVRHWLGEIAGARQREKDFRKNGKEVVEIYSGERCESTPFNILYSNTETLLPALFSQAPRPVVQRRFKDEDPIGKAASLAGQRMLEFLCDTNVEGYETFEESMTCATLDALLPGRGNVSIKYDAEVLEPADGSDAVPVVEWETVCTDSRAWDKMYFGYARKWSKVPWIAYEEYLDEGEAERLFGKEVAAKINYTEGEEGDDEPDERGTGTGGRDEAEKERGSRKTALVYQIWDRAGGKKIRYISPAYNDGYLDVKEDPLGISGFFNCPRPLQFLKKSNDLLPVALYKLYENQAKELNRITTRIQKIVQALKVRGVYDGSLGEEIEKVLKEDDNGLVPTDKGSSLAAEGGLDKAIWLMPLEKLIVVLQQLFAAREQAKRVIYEITGVSDILRGASVASETLGAQKIKESWGTMRLKRLQKEVQRYARDTLRIMLEVAASKLSARTWAQATGLPFITAEQKQQAQMIVSASQEMGQEPDPQALAILQAPGWDDVLALLKDNIQRSYHVDIETNSTIDAEATEDQKNIAEVMNAIAQFLNGIGPMVEKGVMPFEVAQTMLLTIVRRFRFGVDVEDQIKAMKAPPPQDDGDKQAQQAEMQMRQQEGELKLKEGQLKLEVEKMKAQNEQQRMAMEQEAMREEHALKLAEMRAKAQLNEIITASKIKVAQMTAIQKERECEMAMQGKMMDHAMQNSMPSKEGA